MTEPLAGRVAIVTGGGTGIGRGIAVELGRAGAHVVIASRDEEHRRNGVAAVEAAGAHASEHPVDIRDADAVAALVSDTLTAHGRLDIVVNNAAANFVCPAEDYTPNGFRTIVDVVLNGTFLVSQAAARHWIADAEASPAEPGTTTRGSIINIVSTHIESGCPGLAASAASKAGVANLTQTLAVEWARYGIRVNAIAPGVFPNPTVQAQMHPEENGVDAALERARRTVPWGRAGRVEELGRIAAWLASDDAQYITGHTLVVDGGNWLRRGHLMPEYKTVPEQMAERGIPRRRP